MLGGRHFTETSCQGDRLNDILLEGNLPLQTVLAAANNTGRTGRGSISPAIAFYHASGGPAFHWVISHAC
jgi:hypothetical protein